jgi:polysaccharide deacetylase 2 family uncharacterized protein YibQ
MTRQKRPRKKQPRKSARKTPVQGQLIRIALGLGILIALVVTAGVLTHRLVSRPAPIRPPAPKPGQTAGQPPVGDIPRFEIYPDRDIPARPPLSKPTVPEKDRRPMVAIIIDDLGYDSRIAEKFLDLNKVLTFSILPYTTFTERIASRANAKGIETMLHLPMEPVEYPKINPGPGVLLTSMTADELIDQLKHDLDAVPFIRGVNNHMGSRMTARSAQMYQIFTVLKKRDLFFIDSRTSVDTLCRPSARLFQLPFAQRDVFLDHVEDPAFIRSQVHKLLEIAKIHGEAVGIAHPHEMTYGVLRELLPEMEKEVRLVPASAVVRPVG